MIQYFPTNLLALTWVIKIVAYTQSQRRKSDLKTEDKNEEKMKGE